MTTPTSESESHAEPIKCGEKVLCKSMLNRLNDGGVGLSAVWTMNPSARVGDVAEDDEKLLGIVHKFTRKDSGLLLNVCPWCRGEPGYFKRSL